MNIDRKTKEDRNFLKKKINVKVKIKSLSPTDSKFWSVTKDKPEP